MELDDRTAIRTPEGVDLHLTLAGLGSRFGAALIDGLILGAVLVVAVLGFAALGSVLADDLSLLVSGAATLTVFAVLLGYTIGFEAFNDGRTPGKAAFGLRVVSDSGGPAGVWPVVVRNLLRVVDFLPSAYLVGVVCILSTRTRRRVGDLAAGTLVIRDRVVAPAGTGPTTLPVPEGPRWDVSAVTEGEVRLVRHYLERRSSLSPDRQADLAGRIAGPLRQKVAGVEAVLGDDDFLARLAAEKLGR